MASVKILHYTSKKNTDGTSPIVIQVIDGKVVKKKSIANVSEDQWDDNSWCVRPKKHDNYVQINLNISNERNRIENLILKGELNISTVFEKAVNKPAAKKIGLIEYMELLAENTASGKRVKKNGERYAPETPKHYRSTTRLIARFIESKYTTKVNFDDVTLDFYYDLKNFAFNVEKITDNYFGTVIKFLKTAMNEAAEEGLHSNTNHKSKRFIKTTNDVENVYLDESQLSKLAAKDFSGNKKIERARDLFLVGCWTGLRFSDFNNIRPKNIKNGFIEMKTQKTGEMVIIPIHSVIDDIMKRYHGQTANSLPPPISNVKLNEYIKDAVKDAELTESVTLERVKGGKKYTITKPLNELVSTHTARRSFASNMFKLGVPSIVIMAITGHKTEKSFLKYIKVTPREKAEIMREIWARQSMKAV